MLLEVFQQIQQQEEKANQIVQDAKANAKDILKSVEAAVAEQERSASQENRQTLQAMLETSKKDFAKTLEAVMQSRQEQEMQKITACRVHLESTADYIVERVLTHGID